MNKRLGKIGEKFVEELVKAMPNFRTGWLIIVGIAVFPIIISWAFVNWIFIEDK